MKTIPIFTAVVFTTALLTAGAIAQTASPATPAPQVVPMQMPTPNQIIYIPQLPAPAALVNAATAQGVAVDQINQTSTQITVVYKYGNGQTSTICYQLLSAAGMAPVPAGTTTVAVPASTTVIYERPAPAYYYDPFYYPWPWFAPVSVSLGFGFHGGGGYYHGGYHGGYRGGFHGWR
jgi:hypothetical protein